jgi:uncharacterized protein (DUF433 family)
MRFDEFNRITQNPAVMGGKPCIRGMRITVSRILSQLGAGETINELLADYPYLEREDVIQAIRFGAALAEVREVSLPEISMYAVESGKRRVYL